MRITKWIVGVALVVALLVPGIGLARAMPTLQASLTQPAIKTLLGDEDDAANDVLPAINLLLAEEEDESPFRYRVYIPLVLRNYKW